MTMTVHRRKDVRTPNVLMHKIADIRGGVSVNTSELGGDYLPEGAVLSAPVDGICHVVKVARVEAAVTADGTSVKVKKYSCLKAGDFVFTENGGKAVKVAAVDTRNKTFDTVTLAAALGEIAKGGFLVEAKAEADGAKTKAELKYQPLAIAGTGKRFIGTDLDYDGNVVEAYRTNLDNDAWVIGVTKGNPLPAVIADKLKGIINY